MKSERELTVTCSVVWLIVSYWSVYENVILKTPLSPLSFQYPSKIPSLFVVEVPPSKYAKLEVVDSQFEESPSVRMHSCTLISAPSTGSSSESSISTWKYK